MEKRAFLAVVLSTLVFIVFQYFFVGGRPAIKPTVAPIQRDPSLPETGNSRDDLADSEADSEIDKNDFERTEINLPSVSVNQIEEKEIVINTGITTVTLTNRGGKIVGISLKDFVDKQGVELELVNTKADFRKPVSLFYGDKKFAQRTESSTYFIGENTALSTTLSQSKPQETVRFVLEDTSGIRIVKAYTFRFNDYMIDASMSVDDRNSVFKKSEIRFVWGASLDSGDKEAKSRIYVGPTVFANQKLLTESPEKIGEIRNYAEEFKWIATQNKYFLAALIPNAQDGARGYVKKTGKSDNEVGLQFAAKNGESRQFKIYVGPKNVDILKSYGVLLENVVDFGYFDFIGKPVFSLLKILYGYTHNYGIAIIIVTILIKLIFFPLSQKSFQSMKRMQKIQPYMKVLQERYKDDKVKLNSEMMTLYKKHKVNPLGGCLPTVIQIPVFLGLYNVLLCAIELRQAPFLFWITDLAEKDPYYITPVLMGVSMFLQQSMTPTTGDATQAKVMKFMPVMMTFFFLNFPAGLVLYWLVNNVLTIAQQYFIQRQA